MSNTSGHPYSGEFDFDDLSHQDSNVRSGFEDFTSFVISIAEGHVGVASGLAQVSGRIPLALLKGMIAKFGVKGQALYNLFGEWRNQRYQQSCNESDLDLSFKDFLLASIPGRP